MVNEYNAEAVQQAIDNDKSIGKQEGKATHALLKGRAKPIAIPLYRCRYCEKEMTFTQADTICGGNPRGVGTHSLSL